MKASLIAIALMLCAVSIPSFASGEPSQAAIPPENSNKIHLNKANVEELVHCVTGIGKKRAEAIVNYRNAHGPFKNVAELGEVKGIGKQFIKSHLNELESALSIE